MKPLLFFWTPSILMEEKSIDLSLIFSVVCAQSSSCPLLDTFFFFFPARRAGAQRKREIGHFYFEKKEVQRDKRRAYVCVLWTHTHTHTQRRPDSISWSSTYKKPLLPEEEERKKINPSLFFYIPPPLFFFSFCLLVYRYTPHTEEYPTHLSSPPLRIFCVCAFLLDLFHAFYYMTAERKTRGGRSAHLSIPSFFFSYSFHFWKKLVLKTRRPLLDYWST